MRLIQSWFTRHPQSIGETYLEHLRFALWFSGQLSLTAGAALIHGLIPGLFENTAGRLVRDLADHMEKRS